MQSWKRKLRMGMVGGGQGAFIGWVHRYAAALDQQIDFVAGCFSRDPENTAITGQQLYLSPHRCYATYQEMAEAEAQLPVDERIDFVAIVTPTASHFAIAKTFLEAGFHVVCDKPMTTTLQDAQELARLVERTGLVFGVTQNYTGHPLVRHARSLFHSGQMGSIRKVIVEYLQDFLLLPLEKEGMKQAVWRTDPAQAGSAGTLADAGVHCTNLLEYITGEKISAVCADKSTFLPDRELDEDVNMLIRLGNGGKGVITVSQVATGEENNFRIRIYAEYGAVLWEQENPNYLSVYAYNQPRQTLTRGHKEYLSPEATACTRVPTGHPEGYLEAFATIYDDIIVAIRHHLDGDPLPIDAYAFPSVYDGVRGAELIDRIIESCRRGSVWIDTVPQIAPPKG